MEEVNKEGASRNHQQNIKNISHHHIIIRVTTSSAILHIWQHIHIVIETQHAQSRAHQRNNQFRKRLYTIMCKHFVQDIVCSKNVWGFSLPIQI